MFTGPPMIDEKPLIGESLQDDWISVSDAESPAADSCDAESVTSRTGSLAGDIQSSMTPSNRHCDNPAVASINQYVQFGSAGTPALDPVQMVIRDDSRKLGWYSAFASPMLILRVRELAFCPQNSKTIDFHVHQRILSYHSILIQSMIYGKRDFTKDNQILSGEENPRVIDLLDERLDTVALLIRWVYASETLQWNLENVPDQHVIATVLYDITDNHEKWSDCPKNPEHDLSWHRYESLVQLWHLACKLQIRNELLQRHICMTIHWISTSRHEICIPDREIVSLIWSLISTPPTRHDDSAKCNTKCSAQDQTPENAPPTSKWTSSEPNLKDCVLDIYTNLLSDQMHKLFAVQDNWHPEFARDLAMRLWYCVSGKKPHQCNTGNSDMKSVRNVKGCCTDVSKEIHTKHTSRAADLDSIRHESMRTAKVAFLNGDLL